MSQSKAVLLVFIFTLILGCGNSNMNEPHLSGPNQEHLRKMAHKAQKNSNSLAWDDLRDGGEDGTTLLMSLLTHENNSIANRAYTCLTEKEHFS